MPKSVFVSKPTAMTAAPQEAASREICTLLEDRGYDDKPGRDRFL